MKAITFAGKDKVSYDTVADAQLESATDVLVQVRAAGLCGSDLHPYHEREKGLDHGTVMGHEFVGEVVEVGAEVNAVRPGDTVFSPFTTSCGRCFYCRRGLTCRCESGQLFGWVHDGKGLHGGQAEYVRVPLADGTLMKVPEDVSHAAALLLGDILSTGFFCAEQAGIGTIEGAASGVAAALARGTYVVVGCGPVGLMTILAARYLGAEELFAVDTVPERLRAAERLGAIPLDYRSDQVVDIVDEATEGRGADAVMEVVGARAASETAIAVLRPGGVLSSVGVHTEERFGFTPVNAYDKNLTFRSGRCPARVYMQRLAPLVRDGKIDAEFVFSHRMPLADGVRAYEMFDKKLDGCTKVLLEP
ncbi:MAG: alcohol dehydrogenase family protein [Acidobacteriota bacterium]|jgi:threonine dehydrogenase-like Zn-dependent dehydrogenase